jgi:hypothetical protein
MERQIEFDRPARGGIKRAFGVEGLHGNTRSKDHERQYDGHDQSGDGHPPYFHPDPPTFQLSAISDQ